MITEMPTQPRWIGIDQGYSQTGLAVVDPTGAVLAAHRTREPAGNGHDHDVALARLHRLLPLVEALRDAPVHLAGYCYDHSGVAEAFTQAGWTVAGQKGLNDVVGPYGLTTMPGNVVVACCGTFSQTVYIDDRQAVCWPGADVAPHLPDWPLCGQSYARFLVTHARTAPSTPLARAVRDAIGSIPPPGEEAPAGQWPALGRLLSAQLAEDPAVRAYLTRAAAAVVEARDALRPPLPCDIVVGGGAVSDDRLWAFLSEQWQTHGVRVHRATGEPSVGLARYAMTHPDADPWSYIGNERPGWLT